MIDGVPLDTSYTVYSSYMKEVKRFPFIRIASADIPAGIKAMEAIPYKRAGNRELTLSVYRPDNEAILPAVMMIHGGGWNSGSPDMQKALALGLARNGYVTFTVGYRLSPEALFPVGQAVAVIVRSDRARFINCRFLGFQDTLYTHKAGSRLYYQNCYIEGTVDFIFGSSTAWFEECEIYCKGNGYITAASTLQEQPFGYIFNRCRISGDTPSSFYLGRPWRPYARVLFMECELGDVIRPEGWNIWGNPSHEATAFYGEYRNRGAGATTEHRVGWSHQLTPVEAATITKEVVLGSDFFEAFGKERPNFKAVTSLQ